MKNLFKIEVSHKRNFGLDLLRFIAIFTVLISHSITVLPEKYYLVHKFITDGVLIFFVLSGFLIGRILIRDFQDGMSKAKIIRFWNRRWWRTLPAFYFATILLIIFSLIFHKTIKIKDIIESSLFLQNGRFFPESWSLAIEEWFYLSFPIIMLILASFKTKRSTLITIGILLILSFAARFYCYLKFTPATIGQWDSHFRSPIINRLDSIGVGVFGAWIYTYKKEYFTNYKNILFTIGLSIFIVNKIYFDYLMFDFNFYACVVYFTLISFSILLMFPKLYYLKTPNNRFMSDIITKGSLISYSMYLLNLSIIAYLILPALEVNMWIKFALFWLLVIYGSILMYKYIEVPFMRLREK